MFIKLYSNFFHWQICLIKMFLLKYYSNICDNKSLADMHSFSPYCSIYWDMSNLCPSSIFFCCVIIVMNMKAAIMLLWYQKKKRGGVSWCNSTEKWIAMLIFQWLKMNNVSCFGCCIEPHCCCFCFRKYW